MANLQAGDPIRIAAREQEPADIKSQLYYPHYANLRGTVLKLYGEEASVLVDLDSLPTDVRKRHAENENAMRTRWLDGLSEEGRNRLSARDKQFALKYAVLVSLKDLHPAPADAVAGAGEIKRATTGDLTAAEEAFLKQQSGGK